MFFHTSCSHFCSTTDLQSICLGVGNEFVKASLTRSIRSISSTGTAVDHISTRPL